MNASVKEAQPSRSTALTMLIASIDPTFYPLPPTVKFPHIAVAHGDYGLAAVVVKDGVFVYDDGSDTWFGPSDTVRAGEVAARAALDLAAVARAPADRVTGFVWFRDGVGSDRSGSAVASPDPAEAARFVEAGMAMRLTGSSEPTAPWLGSYTASAICPQDATPANLRKLLAATEYCLGKAVAGRSITLFGLEFTVADLTDGRFMLPALLVAAMEDWNLAAMHRPEASGFRVYLEEDPSALLGYKVSDVVPAIPFVVLAPVTATLLRCLYGDTFNLDDIVMQFSRWLKKNGRDHTVVENVEERLAVAN